MTVRKGQNFNTTFVTPKPISLVYLTVLGNYTAVVDLLDRGFGN